MTAMAVGVALLLLVGRPEGGAAVMENAQQEAISAAVNARVKSFEAAERARDPEQLLAHYASAPGFHFYHDGRRANHDVMAAGVRKALPGVRSLEVVYGDLEVSVLAADCALVSATFRRDMVINSTGAAIHHEGAVSWCGATSAASGSSFTVTSRTHSRRRSSTKPSNKRMQLTKLRAAPVRQAEVAALCPRRQVGRGTASQLIRGVRPTMGCPEGLVRSKWVWRLSMTGLMLVFGVAVSAVGSSSGGSQFTDAACDRAKEEAVVALQAKQKNGTLLVRWAAGRPSISIKWPSYGGWHSVLVSARLDVAEPQVAWWTRAVGRREAQYPGDQSSYLRDLAAGKTLTIRLSPEAVRMADASVTELVTILGRRPWHTRLIIH